jgi:hypothetical protein
MADASWEILREEDIKESKCYTLGFLVGETEKHIVIASTYDEESEHTNARLQIPKGMITKQIKVALPEEEVEKKHNLLLREE